MERRISLSQEFTDGYEAGERDTEARLTRDFDGKLAAARAEYAQSDECLAATGEALGEACECSNRWQLECVRLRREKRCYEAATWALLFIVACLAAKVWL